jgi:hypothetical protein
MERGITVRPNFQGCLENVLYISPSTNAILDVLQNLQRQNPLYGLEEGMVGSGAMCEVSTFEDLFYSLSCQVSLDIQCVRFLSFELQSENSYLLLLLVCLNVIQLLSILMHDQYGLSFSLSLSLSPMHYDTWRKLSFIFQSLLCIHFSGRFNEYASVYIQNVRLLFGNLSKARCNIYRY